MEQYPENQTAAGLKVGTIVADWFDEGVRIIIMRGPVAFCVYLGVPEDHPLAGFPYDDLSSISCHGGLTFSDKGGGFNKRVGKENEKMPWPAGYWWYGYDYAHAGDRTDFDYPEKLQKELEKMGLGLRVQDKDWVLSEVRQDAWNASYDFKKLMHLAEKIYAKQQHPKN